MKIPVLSFEALLEKTLAGTFPDRKKFFRTQQIFFLMRDPFWVWCEYHAPPEEAVKDEAGYNTFLRDWAHDHRQEWIMKTYPRVIQLPPHFGLANYKATLKAMFQGVEAIQNPQLWALHKKMYGQGDLIVRDDSHPSHFGPFHYRVVEVKRAKWMKNTYKIQAAALNRILGAIQGYTPPQMGVVLMGEVLEVSYAKVEPELDELVRKWRAIRSGRLKPRPFLLDYSRSPWREYANKILMKNEDLTLLPEVDPNLREKIIEELGIDSLKALKKVTLKKLKKALGDKLGFALFHSSLAYFAKKPILPEGTHFHIPRADRHLYFDFELSDEMRMNVPAHVYLIGIWDQEGGKYVSFHGKGLECERKLFSDFLDYIGDPLQCRLYHWSDFEIRHMRKITEKYPELAPRLAPMIPHCVDLLKFIRSRIYLPVISYSIKNVAPFLGFHWRQKDVGGFESMALYLDYLENGNEEAMRKILTYNEDDCKAMWFVDDALTTLFPRELPQP